MIEPGFDIESMTGLAAAGAQVIIMTTGRGNPCGNPVAPVIKVCGNVKTCDWMKINIDIDASKIITENNSIENIADKLWEKLKSTCNGDLTQAEIDEIEELYQRAKRAFEEVEFWPQEKVDEMVAAVGWEWQKVATAEALARLAVDESGIGVYEDKVAKIQSKTRGTLWDMKGVKTCGLVEENKERGLRIFAKPMGVVADVVPSTNPESTVCCIGYSGSGGW